MTKTPETRAPMRLRVRLFGRYRELAEGPLQLDVPAEATVADLVRVLHATLPGPLPDRPVVAVNHRPAEDDASLGPDDEIALIPPVAGG